MRYPGLATESFPQAVCLSAHPESKKDTKSRDELKTLMKAKELAQTAPLKRTHFCAAKVAIKAKKVAFQLACGNLKHRARIPSAQGPAAHP
jgi:hypothetical protein